jgi:nicotinamidase/pyrazinamidase
MPIAIAPDDALIVVDVQHDFMPGGALGVREGERILEPINALVPRFGRVYATRDWHPADHSSFAAGGGPWPVHCVAQTHGAAFDERFDLRGVDVIIDKGTDVGTDGYSAFAATPLAADLREHGIKRVFIAGLATDYCVKASALDAHAAGFEVIVLADASAAVNVEPDDEERALQAVREAGIAVVHSTALDGNARTVHH